MMMVVLQTLQDQSWWSWLEGYNTQAGEDKANAFIDQYNSLIKQYADATEGVYFVDVCDVVNKDTMLKDGCHPNANGYVAIAQAYYTDN